MPHKEHISVIDHLLGNDIEISGHPLRYYRAGKGESVFLIHGITTYSFIWKHIFTRLSRSFDVIAVDLQGCGDSSKSLEVDHSLKNHAAILLSLADRLGIERMHLVGHDVGGGIVQIMMTSAPGRAISGTLINAVAYDFWPVQPIISMRTPVMRQLAMASLDLGMFRLLILRGMYYKNKVDRPMVEVFNRPMQTREGRKAFLHFAKCLDNIDLLSIEEKIRNISIPVLIIRGEADIYLASSISEKLHREISTSELLKIQTAGHFAMLDEPELIAESLEEFIRKHKDE